MAGPILVSFSPIILPNETNPDGVYIKVQSFSYQVNGSWVQSGVMCPMGNPTEVTNGILYGMSNKGNRPETEKGTIFSYDLSNSSINILHKFNGFDGYYPQGSLTKASNGKLYGMVTSGGSTPVGNTDGSTSDHGVIFELDPANNNFSVKIEFNGMNGSRPAYSNLIEIIDPVVAVCKNATLVLDATGQATLDPTSIDGGSTGNRITLSASKTNFDCSNIGEQIVILTVKDAGGAISTCNATVTVEDNPAPVAVCHNITVKLDASGNGSTSAAVVGDGSSDACGIKSTVLSKSDFSCADLTANPNKVTLSVTDNNGNVSTCEANVTVVDDIKPVANCFAATIILDALGKGTLTLEQVNNGSSDNCGIKSIGLSKSDFTCADIATNPNKVTLTVTDNNNNVSTCEASVTVVDEIKPVAVCQAATVILEASVKGTLTVEQVNNGSSDACGIKSIVLNRADFSCADIASNPNNVTLTVTDNSNNVSTCEAVVIVVDNSAPTAITKNATIVLDQSGSGTLTVQQVDNGSTDNCGIQSMVLSRTSFTCSDMATNPNKVSLSITDKNGNISVCEADVTVINENSTATVIANTSDPVQLGNEVIITISDINSDFASVDWSDNSSQVYPVINTLVEATHRYSAPGVYVVNVSYAVPCEGTKILQYKYVVVYDPNGGFVTGGGWITSLPGAYYANKNLTGKANFGFVAKYKKGSNEVEGNTEFQFSAGNFSFKSASHNAMSLVVAGAKAIYKGNGIINKLPGYSFMVSVIDGDLRPNSEPDKFRIKIWNTLTEQIVYDNQLGADDNIDATTAIKGGSIVIHSNKTGNKSGVIADQDPMAESFSLKVFPNPTTGKLNITGFNTEKEYVLMIIEISGRQIFRTKNTAPQANIDMETMPAGIYNLVIQSENRLVSYQVIKE